MLEGLEHKDIFNKNSIWWNYLDRKGYRRQLIPDTCPLCYTLRDFVKEHRHGVYIVGDGSHTVAVVDGFYIDTYDSGKMSVLYSGRNMRRSYSRGDDTRMELEEMLNNTRDPQEAEAIRKILNKL